eukprot:TRINITY_DN551_c0_g1_i1.p1 TRINITY_DN551_c0_g1~~TRINITY_DN551_c0_g1_i1.p1  ORF type:complete len:335 (-),score=94.61 TRINITY_DN551_c0_g1_i1:65-1069(-)
MEGLDVEHKEDKYAKYRSLDDEELKKQFDIYKFCVYFSWLIIAIFLAVIISISARANSYKDQVDSLNQIIGTYTPTTALKLSTVPNDVLSSMLTGNTITIQMRENNAGVGAVRIYFTSQSTTSTYFSSNGTTLTSGATGTWSLLSPSGIAFIPTNTSALPTDELGVTLLFAYINSLDWIVYSKTTGKLLGVVYHADIVSGNDLGTFSTYKAPSSFQMTMLDGDQINSFFNGKTVLIRTLSSSAPTLKIFFESNYTAVKEVFNANGNITSSTTGVWGVTTDSNGNPVKYDMFYNDNITTYEAVYTALWGVIQVNSTSLEFRGFTYAYDLLSGNAL